MQSAMQRPEGSFGSFVCVSEDGCRIVGQVRKEGELSATIAAINEIFNKIYVKLTMMFHRIVPTQRR